MKVGQSVILRAIAEVLELDEETGVATISLVFLGESTPILGRPLHVPIADLSETEQVVTQPSYYDASLRQHGN